MLSIKVSDKKYGNNFLVRVAESNLRKVINTLI